MLKIIIPIVFFCANINGCSSEHSSSNINNTHAEKKTQNQTNRVQRQSDIHNLVDDEQYKTRLPTRSELRVLTEDAKITENEAKTVILQFDANLNNSETRKNAEANLKKILPHYKEKMLQIGKAKLKEQN